MIAQRVALGVDAASYIRQALNVLPAAKKRSGHPILMEDVENLVRERLRGSVIEGQRHGRAGRWAANESRSEHLRCGPGAGVIEQGAAGRERCESRAREADTGHGAPTCAASVDRYHSTVCRSPSSNVTLGW